MRVLVFHGYLLRGTGSNVYNANLARALAGLGHEVHLLCQERQAASLPWVDATGDWRGGRLRVEASGVGGRRGSVTVYVPDIGGLLPVYVRDRYEGFRVKAFEELTEAELDRYLSANVEAVLSVAEEIGGPGAALANHLVMGPAILARAGLSFAAKIHGSALEYTVKPNPRFLPHAREGMAAASGVLVGSRHTAESLWRAIEDPDLPSRTRLGPPGIDVATFAPRGDADPASALRSAAGRIRDAGGEAFGREAGGPAAIERFAGAPGARVIFVGKLIRAKGLDLLLDAWPAVVAAHPGVRLLIVAFGEGRQALGRRLQALDELAPDSVAFAGRLEHDEVAEILPHADAMVVPSTFPEAFGMVAAEAAACGVLPIAAEHSGLAEVAGALAQAVGERIGRLLSFPLSDDPAAEIAERLNEWLSLDAGARRQAGEALSRRAGSLWSWERVAEGVLAASAGHLDELPEVPRG